MSSPHASTDTLSGGRSRVSAIVTTYNYADYIEEAIASITAQTDAVDEIIVVDDGSTDDTRAIVTRLAVPNLRYIWQENQGAGGARNRGLEEASSELVAYLDADDRWLPTKIEAQRRYLDGHSRSAMVTGGKWRLDATSGEQKLELFEPRARPEFLRDLFIHNQAGNPSMAMVRRSVIQELGGFNTQLRWGQDWDFFIRLAQRYDFAVLNEPVIIYRWHRDNLTHQHRGERADVLYSISQANIARYAHPFRRPFLIARAKSQRDVEKGEDALSNDRRSEAFRLAARSLVLYPYERTRTKVALLAKAILGINLYRKARRNSTARANN